MGFRDFVKGKMDKHGGVTGLARAAVAKPVRMMSGGHGTRSGDPDHGRLEALQAALSSLPEAPDADGYVAVSTVELVQDGKPGQFEVQGHTVAVIRAGGKLFAIDNACLHEDGPLGEGTQEGFVLTCSYHDWKYDVRTGDCLSEPGRRLGCYDVRERDGFVWVGRQRSASSEDRGGEHADGLKTI